jgi:hypothetical protein
VIFKKIDLPISIACGFIAREKDGNLLPDLVSNSVFDKGYKSACWF